MLPPSNNARWCECCNEAEAVVKVTERLGENKEWVHSWCIRCARNKVEYDACYHRNGMLD